MSNKTENKNIISGDIPISDLVNEYPQVVDFLVEEYNFYCMNCFLSEYETLRDGAFTHGIVDEDFDEMLAQINNIA